MADEWKALTELTGGAAFDVERVRLVDRDVAIEGRFELPPLARLVDEDQVFVAAFIRCHGSIKQMEQYFGVSYPTIKNRLNRIGALLPFVEPDSPAAAPTNTPDSRDLLTGLERGDLSVDEVVAELKKRKDRS